METNGPHISIPIIQVLYAILHSMKGDSFLKKLLEDAIGIISSQFSYIATLEEEALDLRNRLSKVAPVTPAEHTLKLPIGVYDRVVDGINEWLTANNLGSSQGFRYGAHSHKAIHNISMMLLARDEYEGTEAISMYTGLGMDSSKRCYLYLRSNNPF
jgi:hypothetical protein